MAAVVGAPPTLYKVRPFAREAATEEVRARALLLPAARTRALVLLRRRSSLTASLSGCAQKYSSRVSSCGGEERGGGTDRGGVVLVMMRVPAHKAERRKSGGPNCNVGATLQADYSSSLQTADCRRCRAAHR